MEKTSFPCNHLLLSLQSLQLPPEAATSVYMHLHRHSTNKRTFLDQKPQPRCVWEGALPERDHFYPSNNWNRLINSRATLQLLQPFHTGSSQISCTLSGKFVKHPMTPWGRGQCAAWKQPKHLGLAAVSEDIRFSVTKGLWQLLKESVFPI